MVFHPSESGLEARSIREGEQNAFPRFLLVENRGGGEYVRPTAASEILRVEIVGRRAV